MHMCDTVYLVSFIWGNIYCWLTSQNVLWFRKIGMKLVDAMFTGLGVECKIWDDSTTILACLDSLEIINPLNENKVLLAEKVHLHKSSGTFCSFCELLVF